MTAVVFAAGWFLAGAVVAIGFGHASTDNAVRRVEVEARRRGELDESTPRRQHRPR